MLSVSNITKLIAGEPLYSKASFQIYSGEKVGLVGPNGSGKTTIFRMIIGEIQPDEGSISIQNNTRIAYFSQHVGEMKGTTALQEVMDSNVRIRELSLKIKSYEDRLCDPSVDENEMAALLDKMGDDQTEFEKLGGFDIESNAQAILTGLGVAPCDHQKPVEDFSSGWKMRIALAKVLILMPDLILMDEPTNYLDMETILWLEEWLKNFKGAILMTTHDRDFMNRVVKKIVEVAYQKITTYSGNYVFYEKERNIRLKQNEAEYNRQQSMLKKEEEFIARFKARASHAVQVQSRVKKLEKIDRVELISEQDKMQIMLPLINRGSNDVLVIRDLSKSWTTGNGSMKPVFSGLNALVQRQDKIAVVGINGAGKSTFLKVVCNLAAPTSGTVTQGPSVTIGYFGQSTVESLNPNETIFDYVQKELPLLKPENIRNLLAAFLFKGDEVFKKIRFLSGGEKTRIILSHLLSNPYNCLVLDEPTNHLDIQSRDVLLETLKRYEGTLLMVSHDRYFLREITTRVFQVDQGVISIFEGNYLSYLEEKN